MAYIGKAPNTAIVNQTTSQSFNGTGSATAFTLNRSVNVSEDLEVFVNNVQQEPGSGKAYTASGTTLTFSAAPASGTGNIYVIYRGEATINPRLEHDANAALAATTGTFSGAFTSPGIDDNADATAITIDSSENVLIGDASPQVTSKLTVSGNGSADTATFMYDGTAGTYLDINTNTANGIISLEANARSGNYPPLTFITSGSERLRIQAGGGISFNGDTAAANALSDFETGSWTPSFDNSIGNGPTVTYTYQIGRYTKVGNRVHWTARISWSAFSMNGSGYALLAGFPFTADSTTAFSQGSNTFGYASGIGGSDGLSGLYIDPGANKFYMTTSANPTAELLGSNIGSAGAFYCGGSVQV